MWTDLILVILSFLEDLKFWKRKKKRRKFEKENNLPKKNMIHPMTLLSSIAFGIFIILVIFNSINSPDSYGLETKSKLNDIKALLDEDKKKYGKYPENINSIKRNNPLNTSLDIDEWDNTIFYQPTSDFQNYSLISKGSDNKLYTKDDINSKDL